MRWMESQEREMRGDQCGGLVCVLCEAQRQLLVERLARKGWSLEREIMTRHRHVHTSWDAVVDATSKEEEALRVAGG